MGIVSSISSLVKSNSIDAEIQDKTTLVKVINNAELFYKESRRQIYECEIAKVKFVGTSILVRMEGYTPGCILKDFHSDTVALKKLIPKLSGENKRKVKEIVKYNLKALQHCSYIKKSWLSRIKNIFMFFAK